MSSAVVMATFMICFTLVLLALISKSGDGK
jgi:hypothetical protein